MKKFTNVKSGGVILWLLLLGFASGSVWGQEVVDKITSADLPATTTSYKDFSGVKITSEALYAGNSAKNSSGAIQLRSKNGNSGIVVTIPGGKRVKSVTVEWDAGTASGRTVDVYAKNTPYKAATDLYQNQVADKGEKVGSLVCPSASPLELDGDYSYIGLRSNNGALYLKSITIVWESGAVTQVAQPSFSPVSGASFADKLMVTASCATDGATIYYTADESNPTTASEVFPVSGLEITQTTTLKAIAVKDGLDNSEVVTATYTKLEPYADIAALKAAGIATVDGVDCVVKLTDAVVTYAEARKAYIQDATAGLCIYGDNTLKAGTTLNGVVQAKLKLYNGLNQLVVSGGEFDEVTVAEGAAIPETEVTLAELNQNFAKYESMRVKVVDATVTSAFTNKNGEISQGGSTMALWAADTGIQVDVQATVDVVGYPGLHNTTPQLNVLQQEDIFVKTAGKKEATLSFEQEVYTVNIGEMVTVKAITNSTAPVVYSTDAQDVVLDENTGELLVGDTPGTVTITANVAENEEYTSATSACIVNIVDPAAQPKPQALVAENEGLYYAMANTQTSGKERLDAVQVDVVNNKVVNHTLSSIEWYVDMEKGYIQDANGRYVAHVNTTTAIDLQSAKYAWNWDGAEWLSTTTSGRALEYNSAGYFRAYNPANTNAKPAVNMTFADGYIRNGITVDKLGTICLPYTVAAEDMVGADFFSVAGKVMKEGQPQSIVLEQVTTLEAGVPYIFSATSDKLIVAYSGKAVAVAGGANGLMGSFEGQDVSEGMYLLTNNTVKKVGSAGGHIGANRAYFNMDEMPEYIGTVGVNQRVISLDGVTAIDGVEAGNPKMVDVYTLSGVKVKSQVPFAEVTQGLAKGIYVVNAKKVVVE